MATLKFFPLLLATSSLALQGFWCDPVTITVTKTLTSVPTALDTAPALAFSRYITDGDKTDSNNSPAISADTSSDTRASTRITVDEDITAWLDTQVPRAKQGILNNIHPGGTSPGAVIASTSRRNPPYFFHWVRDAALTMDIIQTEYKEGKGYEQLMWDFARFSKINQNAQACNPIVSGQCEARGGPGEPKYEVNGEVYKGSWGRFQNDGPALRASTLIRFATSYLAKGGDLNRVKQELYQSSLPATSIIKVDLEYVARTWKDENFDLWEEVPATHFFTRMVQRKAMIEGADFAERMGDRGAASFYRQVATDISNSMRSFWDGNAGFIREHIQTPSWYSRQGRDIATVLAVLHGYNDDGFYSPINEQVIATVKRLIDDFNEIYKINTVRTVNNKPIGPAIGRYREDVYDGSQGGTTNTQGHPWFLATLALAELYYKMVVEFEELGTIMVTPLTNPFFQSFGLRVNSGSYPRGSPEFTSIQQSLMTNADALMRRAKYHMGNGGSMSEQFNRDTGFMLSAENLTWSYASLVTASRAREKARSVV